MATATRPVKSPPAGQVDARTGKRLMEQARKALLAQLQFVATLNECAGPWGLEKIDPAALLTPGNGSR